jgi:hypothetical protein
MRAALALVVLGAAVVLANPARADEAEGKRHWKAGQDLYAQKRFLEAAHEFEAGYAVAPRPLFLMNIGHAYRRANELTRAKTAYEALLRLQPDLPQRREVEDYIKSINDALQAGENGADPAARSNPGPQPSRASEPMVVTPLPRAAPAEVRPMPVIVDVAPAPPVYVEASEPSRPEPSVSVFKRPWFWVLTGALVAGGVAVAVIAARPSSPCPGTLCIREPSAGQ